MKKITLNTSYHKTTSKGTKAESKAYFLTDIASWLGHNFRTYPSHKNNYIKSKINFSLSTNNHYLKNDLSYKEWFNNQIDKKHIDEFNAKQTRKDRMIKDYDYFNYIANKDKNKQAIAEQIIISFGNEEAFNNLNDIMKNNDNWINLWKEYHLELIKELSKIIPDFKIYNSALHLDETTPHIHIIGTGFQHTPNAKQGLKFRLASTNIFTREALKNHHKELRNFNIKFANKLTNLLKQENIVINKDDIFIHKPKGLFKKYDEVEFISNLENIETKAKLKVKDKDTSNIISKIKTNQLSKQDMKVLSLELQSQLKEKPVKEVMINEMLEKENKSLNKNLNQKAEQIAYEKYANELKKEKEAYTELIKSNNANKDAELENLEWKYNSANDDRTKFENENKTLKTDNAKLKDANTKLYKLFKQAENKIKELEKQLEPDEPELENDNDYSPSLKL